MTRFAAGLEGLDDEHATAAAGAWMRERLRRIDLGRLFGGRHGQVQELARRGDGVGTVAAGEQAVVADAVEPLGRTWIRKRRMNSPTSSVMVV